MSDVCVTLPKSCGLQRWIHEGDAAGDFYSGKEWHWYLGGYPPKHLMPGDRIYVTFNGRLRGYAPLVRVEPTSTGYALVRNGGAVAVTITEHIQGFRGPRQRWWRREDERSFPEWRTP